MKHTFLQRFIEFSEEQRFSLAKQKTLIAVSGGMDSVALCSLFHQAKFPFAIAHCNFQLRGEESMQDEVFVRCLAEKYEVPFHSILFDTKQFAEQQKLSIQVAARRLRYEWFEEIRIESGYNFIATAHHLNDSIETVLLNLIKGTGIRGLTGIAARKDFVIRPILSASREQIEAYVKEQQLPFREDSSNAEDKYTRNKIRHQIIPILKEINPSLEQTFEENLRIFRDFESIYQKHLEKQNKHLFLQRKEDVYIPLLKLKSTPNVRTILYEYLQEYEFRKEQVDDMLAAIGNDSGKQFITDRARIIKDRQFLILTKLPEQDFTVKLIEEQDKKATLPNGVITLELLPYSDLKINTDPYFAYLDNSQLEYPLTIRKWKQGDYFYPFGMKKKKKKVSKFFIEQKLPLHEKENRWILESGKRVVWVVGMRIDERFKVEQHTTEVLKLKFNVL